MACRSNIRRRTRRALPERVDGAVSGRGNVQLSCSRKDGCSCGTHAARARWPARCSARSRGGPATGWRPSACPTSNSKCFQATSPMCAEYLGTATAQKEFERQFDDTRNPRADFDVATIAAATADTAPRSSRTSSRNPRRPRNGAAASTSRRQRAWAIRPAGPRHADDGAERRPALSQSVMVLTSPRTFSAAEDSPSISS